MLKQGLTIEMIHNMEKVIIGKREVIELTITTLIAGGHLLLEDVPGVGKTTLANALAQTVDCGFTRIQFTPDTLPSDILGMSIYNMKTGTFEFCEGAIMNHIILADEINRTSPKTQASLLEAMEEGQVTVDSKLYKLPQPFMVIATQNPMNFVGTYNLPEAQLDRFLMKLSIGYPSKANEKQLVDAFLNQKNWKQLKAVITKDELLQIQKEVQEVTVHSDVVSYLLAIIEETRQHSVISLGASPRATLALIRASQAFAYIKGREFVIPDDVKTMAPHVLLHRLILSAEAKLNKQTPEAVLRILIAKLKMPSL